MQKKRKRLAVKTMNALDLPAETMLGGVIMRVYDNTGCVLEGPYTIESYTQTQIIITVEFCKILFEGKTLLIEEMTADTLSFTGQIKNISYVGVQVKGEDTL